MFFRMAIASIFVLSALPAAAQLNLTNGADVDMNGSTGSQIIFPDGSTLDSALEGGASVPDGHGGRNNTVSGSEAFVGGGLDNSATGVASGSYATVGGGRANTAAGDYSFAAGRRARRHQYQPNDGLTRLGRKHRRGRKLVGHDFRAGRQREL